MFSRIKAALAEFDAAYARSAWLAESNLAVDLAVIAHTNDREMRRRARASTLIGVAGQGVWA